MMIEERPAQPIDRQRRSFVLGGVLLILLTVTAACGGADPTPPATAGRPAAADASVLPTVPASAPPARPTSYSPLALPHSPLAAADVSRLPRFTFEIIETYPHDPDAYTQGLVYVDGVFYEGTGLHGRSSLRRVEPETGEILQGILLPAEYFGEGIALLGDRIFQLTLRSGIGFVYDRTTLSPQATFTYPTEGWGLTTDGERLMMSDGTDTLRFLDPETLVEVGRVQVSDDRGPVVKLNELEWVDGEILAHVWLTPLIARIDPASGAVTGWIDASTLVAEIDPAVLQNPDAVLNGIAYDAASGRLFVTGKLWPKLFAVRIVELPDR